MQSYLSKLVGRPRNLTPKARAELFAGTPRPIRSRKKSSRIRRTARRCSWLDAQRSTFGVRRCGGKWEAFGGAFGRSISLPFLAESLSFRNRIRPRTRIFSRLRKEAVNLTVRDSPFTVRGAQSANGWADFELFNWSLVPFFYEHSLTPDWLGHGTRGEHD
jgi:hypothetical protein